MRTLRIGMAQINTTVGDLEGNTEKIIDFINKGKMKGGDIITFPELTIPGYPAEDLLLKPHFIRYNQECLKKIINKVENIIAIIGFVDGKEEIYNAAAIIHNGSLKGVYHKILLPNYGVFDEKRYFKAGDEYMVFTIEGTVIGVNICEDIWEDEPTQILCKHGKADVIINISSSPYHAGKRMIREEMLSKRACENGVFVAYNNLVGGEDELVFDGNSMIFDQKGRLIVQGRQFEEDIILADLNIEKRGKGELPKSKEERKRDRNKRPVLKKIVIPKGIKRDKPPIPSVETGSKPVRTLAPLEEIYNALILGTRDYVRKNGFEKVVIGLSGGIDSALTAVIAVDALCKKNVIGISMPSPYSSKGSITDADNLAFNLGIRLITIPIKIAMDAYKRILEEGFKEISIEEKEDITEENLQARIRGNILMAFSNKFSWLVLTTGNKSETSTGYCTLYGDMAGGFAVIKDVPKTMVYELSTYRNSLEKKDIIPLSIIEKEPSAELRPEQKDVDTLPPYPVLDPILKIYIEEDKGIEEIVLMGYDREIVEKVIRMVDKNEYKRRQSPPGIKITPKAFGKDRRLPITNKYKEKRGWEL
ncbi:MAG: NAD+ synthase [Nitrospinae bacterium]|nr:NAD+ synthase [Nitrospinota bacterium]